MLKSQWKNCLEIVRLVYIIWFYIYVYIILKERRKLWNVILSIINKTFHK